MNAPNPHHAAIDTAVQRARAAVASRRPHALAWRRAQLTALMDMLAERQEEFLEALQHDLGRPRIEALAAELLFVEQYPLTPAE